MSELCTVLLFHSHLLHALLSFCFTTFISDAKMENSLTILPITWLFQKRKQSKYPPKQSVPVNHQMTLLLSTIRTIMKQLFEAVSFIHSNGIVHRDLKPENILLDDKLDVKITDFGFAKVIGPHEKLYELCGTPGYLAPELLKASMYENVDGYDKKVDIWACGVIMYTLLVGFPPFWHRKQLIMLRNIMEGKYEFCSPEWDDITDQPKDLIRKLLVVDPRRRITAEEALQDEFFQVTRPRTGPFNARKTFELALLVVRAAVRIRRLKNTPEPLSVEIARFDPYRIKTLRKAIDGCAFKVYNHWVKRGEVQNRAALFENHPKQELKLAYQNSVLKVNA